MSFNQLQSPIPPPPLPTIKNNLLINSKPLKVLSFDECKWAVKYPDVQRACFFSKVCPVLPPKQCKFTKIEPILQIGPCCGIVALSMLFNGKISVEKLLNEAQENGFTKNGEMFSADFMFELLDRNLNEDDNLHVNLYDGILNNDDIKKKIENGSILLVPYDADVNNSPCLKNGHKAHWAIILGYLKDDYEEFYVFARHGKSKYLDVWSLNDLSKSNSNLKEFAQPSNYPSATFVVPEGGMAGEFGLKNKTIIIEGMQNEIINCLL